MKSLSKEELADELGQYFDSKFAIKLSEVLSIITPPPTYHASKACVKIIGKLLIMVGGQVKYYPYMNVRWGGRKGLSHARRVE